MEHSTHELYENARKRLNQKKFLYYHFILFILGSLFLFVTSQFFKVFEDYNWFPWLVTLWVFLFLWHFIKVYITDRFMNKDWEREQIDKLIAKQQTKIKELDEQINKKQSLESDNITKSE